MFYNLKIAFRNLRRNGVYSVINIAGLAISLTACAFILLWVEDEKSYDRFHDNADEIYMGVAHFTNSGIRQIVEATSGLFATEAKANFSEVKDYCRIRSYTTSYILADGESTGEKKVFVADSTFFSFFNFPIIAGYSPDLLRKPDEVVISESLANELFGGNNPIGKMLRTKEKSYHIAAVMKDFLTNTYLPHADLVIPQNSDPESIYTGMWNGWGGCEFLSFIRVKKGTDIEQLAKDITNLQPNSMDDRYFTLQPLINLHLYTLAGEPSGIKTVWIFIWIACAIMAISCINYVNLVTGRSAKRNREVGLKKMLGARKPALFLQMMTEAVILFLTALCIAVYLNMLLGGVFNHLSGKEIYFEWNNWNIWTLYGLMFVAVIILAGIYPALSISSFKLLNMLQGKLANKKNDFFRKSLVVFQFTASVILIIATIVLEAQLTYVRRMNLGYDQEYVFTCRTRDMADDFLSVKEKLMQNTSILSVNGASARFSDIKASNTTRNWEGKIGDGHVSYHRFYVDSTFFRNMSMEFASGAAFAPGEQVQYIINETMAKAMGLTEPIVGKWLEADFGIRGTIVGVIKDFHYHSLYREISPLVIFHNPDRAGMLYVRTTAKDAGKAIAAVEKEWNEYNANYTFDYSFIDETFEQLYRADIRTGRLFVIFSFIAILISCLGLFGLVTYTAEARFKEIAIRKTLGASVSDIVTMLSKDFLILVGIAMLIAVPLAYYWLDTLLRDFAYRINIGWWMFALSVIIIITLTLLTVGWQVYRAATANPATAIKTE